MLKTGKYLQTSIKSCTFLVGRKPPPRWKTHESQAEDKGIKKADHLFQAVCQTLLKWLSKNVVLFFHVAY